jgi:hypothetical protein
MHVRPRARKWLAAFAASLVMTALAVGADAALASHRTITATEALAVATAISIRHADVPELKQESNPITAAQMAQTAHLTSCVRGVPVSKALANVQSPNFANSSGTSVTLNSGTEILPSTSLVAKDFAAVTGSRGLPCLLSELRRELVGTPPKGETVTSYASRLSTPVSGADGAFADRFNVIVRVTRASTTLILPLYVDLVGFAYGQAEVSLSVETVGSKPPRSLERRLAALLLARARTTIG